MQKVSRFFSTTVIPGLAKNLQIEDWHSRIISLVGQWAQLQKIDHINLHSLTAQKIYITLIITVAYLFAKENPYGRIWVRDVLNLLMRSARLFDRFEFVFRFVWPPRIIQHFSTSHTTSPSNTTPYYWGHCYGNNLQSFTTPCYKLTFSSSATMKWYTRCNFVARLLFFLSVRMAQYVLTNCTGSQ